MSDTFQARPSEAAGLLAVSAWNDNGQGRHVSDPQQLYRSDFFPGLGWMLTRSAWEELRDQWPAAYWDDWLREPARRRDRHIIRPEVSRTYHIGKRGVSNSEFGQVTYHIQPLIINTVRLLVIYIIHLQLTIPMQYLTEMRLNDVPVDFTRLDLSYLYK